MKGVTLATIPEVEKAVRLIDGALDRYPKLHQIQPTNNADIHSIECFLLMTFVLRHVQAVNVLARRDMALLPSAIALARAAFEASIRIRWTLQPDEPMERDARWLAQFRDRANQWSKLTQRVRELGVDVTPLVQYEQLLARGYEKLELLFNTESQRKYDIPARRPDMVSMLHSLGERDSYVRYMLASDYAHASQIATQIYKDASVPITNYGEFIKPEHWVFCLRLSWHSFYKAGYRWLETASFDTGLIFPKKETDAVESAITKIKASTFY
jgi:hypothetical protein